jgi:hypothetical protein
MVSLAAKTPICSRQQPAAHIFLDAVTVPHNWGNP